MEQNFPSLTAYKVAMMRAAHQILDNPKVFEVDHPATQEWKRQQLNAAKIPMPETLTFAPIDLESQSLADLLQEAGFRTDEPSFFSWLGVTVYLTREAMMATMEYISSSTPSGSGIVFDFVIPPASQNIKRRSVFGLLARRVAGAGEPWQSFFDPNSLIMDLKAIGFTQTENIGPGQINARFFSHRTDKLMVGNLGHLLKAAL
jgi:methyltransferase (TIGR00027 family)